MTNRFNGKTTRFKLLLILIVRDSYLKNNANKHSKNLKVSNGLIPLN